MVPSTIYVKHDAYTKMGPSGILAISADSNIKPGPITVKSDLDYGLCNLEKILSVTEVRFLAPEGAQDLLQRNKGKKAILSGVTPGEDAIAFIFFEPCIKRAH